MSDNNKSSKKSKTIKKVVALVVAMTGLTTTAVYSASLVYDAFFQRYDKKEIFNIFGEYDYSRVQHKIERKLIRFDSDKEELQGYLYTAKRPKGLVIVSHGLHSGADDYLPFIIYFVQNGYSVFAYDCKGTYNSSGDSTVGMCTSLVDLDHALKFIENDKELSKMPRFLFGHSWGGYAVASVLCLHKDIKAVASIAGFNNGYTLINEKGFQYAGPLSNISKPFLDVYQKILFKSYTNCNSVDGINGTNIPVFIAHGENDNVILYNMQAIISYKSSIRNDNVTYYIGTGAHDGHMSILFSDNAIDYQKRVDQALANLKKQKGSSLTDEDLIEFANSVDHELYSEVNPDLMGKILEMFNKA